MSEKTKKIIRWSGAGAVALGSVALFIGGATEGHAVEVVGAVFSAAGLITGLIKGLK